MLIISRSYFLATRYGIAAGGLPPPPRHPLEILCRQVLWHWVFLDFIYFIQDRTIALTKPSQQHFFLTKIYQKFQLKMILNLTALFSFSEWAALKSSQALTRGGPQLGTRLQKPRWASSYRTPRSVFLAPARLNRFLFRSKYENRNRESRLRIWALQYTGIESLG